MQYDMLNKTNNTLENAMTEALTLLSTKHCLYGRIVGVPQ